MFAKLRKFFSRKQVKRIAFIDGDQQIPRILDAYHRHLHGIETHLIRQMGAGAGEPHALRGDIGFNKIYLRDMSVGKEIVDKFIGAYIQKAVAEGYQEITVVSGDYDFIDIFKMAMILNPGSESITFRMIVPSNAQGRVKELPLRVCNIDVVKM